MISLLARLFIKNRDAVTDPAVRRKYGALCGTAGIVLNLLLFGFKYFAGVLSGSIAVTADAFNNLSDAGSSLVTLLGFRLAGIRPDAGHPYGHGRLEYVSGLVVSALILIMGFELGKSSVEKILRPQPVEFGWLSAAILLASVAVKLYMFCYNRSIGKKISSAAMRATATDSLSDAAATAVVLLGMVIGRLTGAEIDGWAGVLVALFILYSGAMAAWDTLSPLLGQAPEPELVQGIRGLALAHPEIRDIHDLMVHDYGPGRRIVTFHAEVSAEADLTAIHRVIDDLEYELFRSFGCAATIHIDPIEPDSAAVSVLRQSVAALAREVDERITIHDFRILPGTAHVNLIFDAVLPRDCALTDAEAEAALREKLGERYPGHHIRINIDHALV